MFYYFIIGFVAAVTLFYALAQRPSSFIGETSAIISLLIVGFAIYYQVRPSKRRQLSNETSKTLNLFAGLIIGFSWAFWQSFFTLGLLKEPLNEHYLVQANVLSVQQALDEDNTSAKGLSNKVKLELSLDKVRPVNSLVLQGQSSTIENARYFHWFHPKAQIAIYFRGRSNSAEFPSEKRPKIGETWVFALKLKSIHSSQNFLASDYETYLFQQGVTAKGYLPEYTYAKRLRLAKWLKQSGVPEINKPESLNRDFFAYRLSGASAMDWRCWRQTLMDIFSDKLGSNDFWRLYQALLFGERNQMTDADWQLLQNTGTIHLMAISGLHMGIMALIGALLFKGLWWLGFYRVEAINLPVWMAAGAGLLSSFYLLLSGGSIPTQRAWLMVMSVLLFIFLYRRFQPWTALSIAVLAILVYDSRSVLSPGFWLSFTAVSLIFMALPWIKSRSRWQQLLVIQAVLTVGLAPLLIWQFHQLPLIAFIANLVAVPLISLIGLPLLFLSAALTLVSDFLGHPFFAVTDQVWQGLWHFLQFLQNWQKEQALQRVFAQQSVLWLAGSYLFLLALFFVLVKLTKVRGLKRELAQLKEPSREIVTRLSREYCRQKRQSLLWLFVLLIAVTTLVRQWNTHYRVAPGEFILTVFDVGQGQALAIMTSNHRLIYDAGPKWGRSAAAQFSLLPWWKAQGNPAVDKLIISHSDSDHAGGLQSLLENLPVRQLISSQLNQLSFPETLAVQSCYAGQKWRWDGVLFEFLSPTQAELEKGFLSDNDLSCVLKITSGHGDTRRALLIPGDLSARGERKILHRLDPQALQAQVLIAGHHGSHYSSSLEWLKAVRPQKIIFSSGYQNRFDFPNDKLLKRLKGLHSKAELYNTACSGALLWRIAPGYVELRQQARKDSAKWYYQRCLTTIK